MRRLAGCAREIAVFQGWFFCLFLLPVSCSGEPLKAFPVIDTRSGGAVDVPVRTPSAGVMPVDRLVMPADGKRLLTYSFDVPVPFDARSDDVILGIETDSSSFIATFKGKGQTVNREIAALSKSFRYAIHGLPLTRLDSLSLSLPKESPGTLSVRSIVFSDSSFGFDLLSSPAFSGDHIAVSAAGIELGPVPALADGVPAYALQLSFPKAGFGTRFKVSGKRTVTVRLQEGMTGVSIPLALLGAGVGTVLSTGPEVPELTRAGIVPIASEKGIPVLDAGSVIDWPKELFGSGEYRLSAWSADPSVLIFDFRDYAVQDAWLKRLAFFTEKKGFKGKLASDSEIAALHGWNAHDYRPRDLAAFFSKAEREKFKLNASERLFKDILVRHGIIVLENGEIREGSGAVISISRESADYLRRTFMVHESLHALFFSSSAFRSDAMSIYASMDKQSRAFLIDYFDCLGYDVRDEYLMANECMAYMLQQPESALTDYVTKTMTARYRQYRPDSGDRFAAAAESVMPAMLALQRRYAVLLAAVPGFVPGRNWSLSVD